MQKGKKCAKKWYPNRKCSAVPAKWNICTHISCTRTYAHIYTHRHRGAIDTLTDTHTVLNGSQCCFIIKLPWCNWQHAFWHVTSIHRRRRCRKMSHTPLAASFLLFLYQDVCLSTSLPLNLLSVSYLSSLLPFLLFLSSMHFCFLFLLPFIFTCLHTLLVHLFNNLCPTILSHESSASLKLAAQILFGIPISVSPATVLFTPLLPLYHLSKITYTCPGTSIPVPPPISTLSYEW